MSRYRQNPTIAWRQIDDQSVLIDPVSGVVFVLNELGGQVWELLEHARDTHELVNEVRNARPAAPVSLGDDIDRFLTALVERELAVATA
ncbi:MAG: PqqD family protein [Planctomycetota bacterium]